MKSYWQPTVVEPSPALEWARTEQRGRHGGQDGTAAPLGTANPQTQELVLESGPCGKSCDLIEVPFQGCWQHEKSPATALHSRLRVIEKCMASSLFRG